MTVKEGQNLEMACAFQSGTASVYLEIQWWFVKAPEPTDSEEEVDAQEVQRSLCFCFDYPLCTPLRPLKNSPLKHTCTHTPTHADTHTNTPLPPVESSGCWDRSTPTH